MKKFIFFVLLFSQLSCNNSNNSSPTTSNNSVPTGPTKSELQGVKKIFKLDSVSKSETSDTRITRLGNKEILVHLNTNTNTLYFYDFNNSNLETSVTLSIGGPYGVGRIDEFFVLNERTLFVLDSKRNRISKISNYYEGDITVESKIIQTKKFSLISDLQNSIFVINDFNIWIPTIPFFNINESRFKEGTAMIKYDFSNNAFTEFKFYPQEYDQPLPTFYNRPITTFTTDGTPIVSFKASDKVFKWDDAKNQFIPFKVNYPDNFSLNFEGNWISSVELMKKITNQNSAWSDIIFDPYSKTINLFYRIPDISESVKFDYNYGVWNIGLLKYSEDFELLESSYPVTRNTFTPIIISQDGLWIQDIYFDEDLQEISENFMAYLKIVL